MDLNRLPNDQKLDLCRWYFRVGCICLPFFWAVNSIWFYKEAFTKPAYDEQKQIRKYVIMSAIGALCWAIIFATWAGLYQTYRVSWGEMGEALAFTLPLGRA